MSGATQQGEEVQGGYPGETADGITEHDSDPGNVLIRAGALRGMAMRATGDDRLFLLRASRSLLAFAELLRKVDS